MIQKWFSKLFKKSKKSNESLNVGAFISDGSFINENINDLYKVEYDYKEIKKFFEDNKPDYCRAIIFGVSQDGLSRRPDMKFSQPTICKFEKNIDNVSYKVQNSFYVFYKWHVDNGDF